MASEVRLQIIDELANDLRNLRETQTELLKTGQAGETANRQLETSSQKSGVQITSLAKTIGRFAAVAGVAFTAVQGVRFLKDVTLQAAAAKREATETEVLYGRLTDAVRERARAESEAFRLTRTEAGLYLNEITNVARAQELSTEQSAEMAPRLLRIAGAMREIKGVRLEDSVAAFNRAMQGQRDGLAELGINIDDTRLKQLALENGIIDYTRDLSTAEKAQAAYLAIVEDTSAVVSRARSETDTMSDATLRLAQEWDELKLSVGEFVTPLAGDVVGALADIARGARDAAGEIKALEERISDIQIFGEAGEKSGKTFGDAFRDGLESTPLVGPYLRALGALEDEAEESGTVAGKSLMNETAIAIRQSDGQLRDALDQLGPVMSGSGQQLGRTLGEAIGEATTLTFAPQFEEMLDVAGDLARERATLIAQDIAAAARAGFDASGLNNLLPGGKGIEITTAFSGLTGGGQALASFIVQQGATISSSFRSKAEQAAANTKTDPEGDSFHTTGQALDIPVSPKPTDPQKRIWDALYRIRGSLAELYAPTFLPRGGLYRNGEKFEHDTLQAQHQNHIHVAFTGSKAGIEAALRSAMPGEEPFNVGLKIGNNAGEINETADAKRRARNARLRRSGRDPDDPDEPSPPVGRREFRQRRAQFGNLQRNLRRGSALGLFGEPIIEDAELAIRQLRKLFRDGVITEDEADAMDDAIASVTGRMSKRLRDWRDDVKDLTRKAMQDWRDEISSRRDEIAETLGDVARDAVRAFDRETENLLDANRARLDGLTAAEAELERLRRGRDRRDTGREISAAHDELQLAQASGDPERVRDATRRLEDARLSEHERGLELTADAERKALTEDVERQEKLIRDDRENQRLRFEGRLEEIIAGLENESGVLGKANTDLILLLGEFVPGWNEQGFLMGSALAEGIVAGLLSANEDVESLLGFKGEGPPGRQTPTIRRKSFRWFDETWTKSERAKFREALGERGQSYADWRKQFPELDAVFAAKGGVTRRPLIAGEVGSEGLIPLNDPKAVKPIVDALGGGGGTTVVIQGPWLFTSQDEVERGVRRMVETAQDRAIRYTIKG